jgi:hypothetical protein
MGKSNLRQTLDAFADNVKAGHPTSLRFDGKMLYLTVDATAGAIQSGAAKVGITSDLRDDTCYRLTGDDIDDVAEEMGETLTDAEKVHAQKGIEAGFGSSWHDIVESAIDDVVASRRES